MIELERRARKLDGYREYVRQRPANPPLLAAAGMGAAVLFLVFGLYGLSGALFLRPLRLLRPGLVGIALIYLIRGVAVIPAVLAGLQSPGATGSGTVIISASAAPFIGILHAAGTAAGWNELRTTVGGAVAWHETLSRHR